MSSKVVCTGTLAENNVKIAIGGTANSAWEPSGWDVGVHQGKDYWLGAVCEHSTGMVTSARSYVNLSGSGGLRGTAAAASPGGEAAAIRGQDLALSLPGLMRSAVDGSSARHPVES